eukprot:10012044-Heterocapsa_arctica.AAC.1
MDHRAGQVLKAGSLKSSRTAKRSADMASVQAGARLEGTSPAMGGRPAKSHNDARWSHFITAGCGRFRPRC